MRGRAAVLLALAVLPASACAVGGSAGYEETRSAAQILGDANSATASSGSFHIHIDETAPTGPATADMDVESSNVDGKITSNEITARIEHVGDQTFIYGSDLAGILQTVNPEEAAVVKAMASEKWVLVPSELWSSSFSDLVDVRKMSACLTSAPGAVKKGTSVISGQAVVEIDDQARSKIYVQTAAPHHFVRLIFSDSDSCATDSTAKGQTIDLSKFGANFGIAVPAGYVDLTALASGG